MPANGRWDLIRRLKVIFRTRSPIRALSTKKKDTGVTNGAHNEYFVPRYENVTPPDLVFDNIHLFIQEIHGGRA